MISSSPLLSTDNAFLLIIDIQEKFLPALKKPDEMVAATQVLVQVANTLAIPVVVSEQYPQGLGTTVPDITQHLTSETPVFAKKTFGCYADPVIQAHIDSLQRKQAILCGIETHVCVSQTAHQLIAAGYQVHLIEEALTSRTKENKKRGLKKMAQSGAIRSSVEIALFELLQTADHPQFKPLQALIKDC